MTRAEVSALAERILPPELGATKFDRISVTEEADSTDEPSLFVDVFLRPGSSPVAGDVSSRAHRALSRSLLENGENRFPYLRLRHPDGEAEDNRDRP